MKKVIGLVIGLVPVSAFAECVPAPDCASIGYTETSCDGDSLKCPFDTTKLYCPPCDSSFRYTCTGDNIKNPIGNACNNKYVSCECIAGTTFINGECVCDTSCDTIGNIYYSDGSCSSCNLTDKTPVGIVAYKDADIHLLMALNIPKMKWATSSTNIPALENISTEAQAQMDMNGADNTLQIIEFFSTDDSSNNAAWYCYNYAPDGFETSKNKWYFPSLGELYHYVHKNYTQINSGFSILGLTLNNGWYWSSTEMTYSYAWHITLQNGSSTIMNSNGSFYNVACLYNIQ